MEHTPNYFVSFIQSSDLDKFWPLVQESISAAIAHSNGELDIDVIYNKLKKDQMFLLLINDGNGIIYASTTIEIRIFDSGKQVLNVTTTGGTGMDEWLPELVEACSGIAKALDCEEIYVVGRMGWLKTLKKHGFKPVHQVVSMEI